MLLASPQLKRQCCESIATIEHSVGAPNGGPGGGAAAADGDTDGSAVGEGGEDSLGAVAIGTHAVSKDSNPIARRNPGMRTTEP